MASPSYGEHHPIFPIIIGKADQKLCPCEIGAFPSKWGKHDDLDVHFCH